jgi:hypothetical protein
MNQLLFILCFSFFTSLNFAQSFTGKTIVYRDEENITQYRDKLYQYNIIVYADSIVISHLQNVNQFIIIYCTAEMYDYENYKDTVKTAILNIKDIFISPRTPDYILNEIFKTILQNKLEIKLSWRLPKLEIETWTEKDNDYEYMVIDEKWKGETKLIAISIYNLWKEITLRE